MNKRTLAVLIALLLLVCALPMAVGAQEEIPGGTCVHSESIEQNDGYPETCDKNGLTNSWVCRDCGETTKKQEVINNFGTHQYNGKQVVKQEAQCHKTGIKGQTNTYCSNPGCGSAKPTYYDTTDCVPVSLGDGWAETCDKNGMTDTIVCKWCKTVLQEQKVIDNVKTHNYNGKLQVKVEATCDKDGKGVRYCSNPGCGSGKPVTLPMLGCNPVEQNDGYPETCVKNGLTNSWKCSRCGKTTQEQTVIDNIKTHVYSENLTVKTEATCKKDGYAVRYCTNPGCGSGKPVILPMLGCDPVEQEDGYPETCVKNGMTNSWKCSRCGETTKEQEVVDNIKTHNYNGKLHVKEEPTCKKDGKGVRYCTNPGCGSGKPEVLPMLGCDPVEQEDGYPETCVKNGMTNSWKCSRCGETTKEQEVIDNIKTHNYNGKLHVKEEPTCDKDGKGVRYCTNPGCGSGKPEVLPMLGCDPVEQEDGYPETCVKDGMTNSWVCSRCGKTTKEQEVINEIKTHRYEGKLHVQTAPTCQQTGRGVNYCINPGCGSGKPVTLETVPCVFVEGVCQWCGAAENSKPAAASTEGYDYVPRTGSVFVEWLYTLIFG